MKQDYAIFKNNTPIEVTNNYFNECMQVGKVCIVIKTMRKYARIEYDFYTLGGKNKKIKDLSTCNIADKIKAYAFKYALDNNIPRERMSKVIADTVGAFEFYIEDVEKVGKEVSEIITNAVNSGCIEFTSMEEMLDELDPEKREALKNAHGI